MMKILLFTTAIALVAAGDAHAASRSYASCHPPAKLDGRPAAARPSGDPNGPPVLTRLDALQTDIARARNAGRLGQTQAARLFGRLGDIRVDVQRFVVRQGFLSAAERATYDRQLDAIALVICRA